MSKRFSDRLLLSAAPWLAGAVIRMLYRIMRIEILGAEYPRQLVAENKPAIYVFWHDQLLMMVKGYLGDRQIRILISASQDGELIARTMSQFGFEAVRGSSNRGAAAALKEMLRLVKSTSSLAITPDGPKGPRHVIKPGVVQVACRSGRPVVPMAFVCSHGHRFGSWDRFLLPYPWGRGVYAYGRPLYCMPEESSEDFQDRVECAMNGNLRRAAVHLETYGLSAV
jgi:lysophospholipid acyltransferase (LPLAT)-like uncharacterized protein